MQTISELSSALARFHETLTFEPVQYTPHFLMTDEPMDTKTT